MLKIENLQQGDQVYWNDPDNGISSGFYKVLEILSEEVLVIENDFGTLAEVFIHELS